MTESPLNRGRFTSMVRRHDRATFILKRVLSVTARPDPKRNVRRSGGRPSAVQVECTGLTCMRPTASARQVDSVTRPNAAVGEMRARQLDPNYRTRIYASYSSGRHQSLAPASVQGLAPRAPYLNRLIRLHFPNDRAARILDLGCGYGAVIHFARQAGYRNIRGVDGSQEQVAAARRLGIEGVEAGDVMPALADCVTRSLDCVVAFDLIEHFTRDELLHLVDEVKRVLVPGGIWIIHAPNGESPFGSRVRYGDLTHELAFTRTSIGQLLYSSGFSAARSYEDAPIPHGLRSSVRRGMWFAFRGMLRLYLAAETGETARDVILSQNILTVARS